MQALTRNLFRPFSLSLGLTVIVLGIFFGLQMQRQVAATALQAEETITADITKDTTWAKGTYFLDKSGETDKTIIVKKDATLTIEAGAIIKGTPNTLNTLGAKLQVEGRLVALGTATDPVIFTSQKDSGSTQWSGIVFEGGTGLLRNVIVRNSGFRNGLANEADQSTPGIGILINNVQKGEVRIEQSQIVSTSVSRPSIIGSEVPDYGIYASNSNVVISETRFIKNFNVQEVDYPLFITGTSNFTLTGNSLAYAGSRSLIVLGGPNSSPLRPQQGSQGYLIKGGFNVPKGKKLLIEPGVQILADWLSNTEFNVKGNLEAVGSSTKPITFDAALSGAIWPGLVFDGGTGYLGYVKVRNGGKPSSISIPTGQGSNTEVAQGNIIINKGQVRIENSQVTNARSGGSGRFVSTVAGIHVQDGQTVISKTSVGSIGNKSNLGDLSSNGYGLLVAGTSVVTLTDSSEITNPLSSGISVLGGQVMVANRSKVWQNALSGIVAKGGKTIVDCASISDNNGKSTAATDGGISIADPATLTIIGSSIARNKTSGINSTNATSITAEYNWWGDATGPTNTKLNPKGKGDKISDKVDAIPFLKREQCVATLAISFQGPKELAAGAPFTYTVLAENKGLSRASSITTTITLPSSTSFKSAPANCKQDSVDLQKVICNVANLNPLEIANLAIVGTTKVGTLGVITFTNAITGADFILNTVKPAQYTPIVKDMADLSIGIKPSQAKVEPGNVVTYTVTITNQRIPSENVLITTTLPLSGTYASASKDCKKDSKNKLLLTCQLGTIKVETKQITFSVKISATVSGLNVAKVQIGSSTSDLNAKNNQNETKITITVKPKVVPVTPTEPPRLYMPLILRQPPEPTPTLTPIVTPTPISGTGDLTKTLVLRR